MAALRGTEAGLTRNSERTSRLSAWPRSPAFPPDLPTDPVSQSRANGRTDATFHRFAIRNQKAFCRVRANCPTLSCGPEKLAGLPFFVPLPRS